MVQEGTPADHMTHSPMALGLVLHLDFASSLQTPRVRGSRALLSSLYPGPWYFKTICCHCFLVFLKKLGLPWSHLLYQRAEATKITGVWIQEIKNSVERELENMSSFKQPFSGLQFIDSNKSRMSDYMNENLFSKWQLLQGHYFVNSNNRNTFLLDSKERIC